MQIEWQFEHRDNETPSESVPRRYLRYAGVCPGVEVRDFPGIFSACLNKGIYLSKAQSAVPDFVIHLHAGNLSGEENNHFFN